MKLKLSILLLFLLVSACANNSANKDVDDSQPISVSTDFENKPNKKILEMQIHSIQWMKLWKIFRIK